MARKKKKSKTPFLVGGIFIFIMISSAFGVIFGSYSNNSQKVKYGDYTFTPLADGMWKVKIDGRYLAFDFTPDALEDLELDPDSVTLLQQAEEIDFTYDYDSDAAPEIALIQYQMEQSYFKDRYFRSGSTKENEFDKPVITCKDATASVPVLYFVYGNETKLTNEKNCIIAEASRASDLNALKDRIVYGALKVME